MASMTELCYGDEPTWAISTFYDYNDHNDSREVDPQYTQTDMARYMNTAKEIRCCSKCEHKLRAILHNVQGVDSVVSAHRNKLLVTGSATSDSIHYALKPVLKHHHHFWLQKIHNPFRGLIHRYSHSPYDPSWNQTANGGGHYNSHNGHYKSDDTWRYGERYGPNFGQGPQHHYQPGTLRALFDSYRSSNHSNSGYSYY